MAPSQGRKTDFWGRVVSDKGPSTKKHPDGWLIALHPVEVVFFAALLGAAFGLFLARSHEVHLLLWARGHVLLLSVVGALVIAAGVEVFVTIRNRPKHGKIERDWPAIAKGMGLEGAKLLAHPKDKDGETLKLQLNGFAGQSMEDVVSKTRALEVAAKARRGRVRVIPDASGAHLVDVRIDKHDPLAKPIRWTGSTMKSCTDPMVLGVFGDTWPVKVDWSERHILIGGITGSGKSNAVNIALANLAPCPDLTIWGVDLKGGMELGPWRDALERLAVTPDEALDLLQRAVAEMDRRTLRYGAQGIRKHTPTPDEPRLLVVVDELSRLDDKALAQVLRIATQGRAPGVQLLLATQQPSAKQLGTKDASGTALRGQMGVRICMAVQEGPEVDMILGDGHRKEGFWAERILNEKGSFLIVSRPEHFLPRPARTFEMKDEDVPKAVETARLARLNSEIESQPESQRDLTDDERLLAIIEAAGPDGIKGDDAVAEFGKSRATVNRYRKRLEEQGLVVSDKAGRWRKISRK